MGNLDPDSCIKEYLLFLRAERNLSEHTLDSYGRDLSAFWQFSKKKDWNWSALKENHIGEYVSMRFFSGITPRTLQRELSSLRGFFKHCVRRGWLSSHPFASYKAPRSSHALPKVLTVDQIQSVLDEGQVADTANGKGLSPKAKHLEKILDIRDKSLIDIAYSSALRVSELASICLHDIDLADQSMRVIGKGRKQRELPVGSKACSSLACWLQVRSHIAADDETALFVGRRGKRLSVRAIQKRMAAYAQKKLLAVHLHPHMLRHSCASHLLQSSGNIRAVQELLGHSDVKTTQIYTHLDFQHLATVYDKFHPRAGKVVVDKAVNPLLETRESLKPLLSKPFCNTKPQIHPTKK